jgi:nucleotide-binding universal stress UspA family protein
METTGVTHKHILYATDFSESWKAVFSHAMGIANQYKAKLTLLYVVNTEMIELLTFDVGLERSTAIDKKFTEAKEFVSKARDKVIDKISEAFGSDVVNDINVIVERGNPVKTILNIAQLKECDMIVMGFKGKSTLEDYTIGSTVNKVLHRSKLPVLVIHNI